MTFRSTRPLRSLADLEAFEETPVESRLPYRNIYELFAATAGDFSDRLALMFLDTAQSGGPRTAWTHGDLFRDITRAANVFTLLGLGRTDIIAYLLPPHPLTHLVLWGGQTAAVVAPINLMLEPDHIAAMVRSTGAKVLVVPSCGIDPRIHAMLPHIQEQATALETILYIGGLADTTEALSFERLLAEAGGDVLRQNVPAEPSDVAALFHTGGTTGAPKFARITHWGLLTAGFGVAQMLGLNERDRFLNGLPLFHLGGTVTLGLSFLGSGGANIIPTYEGLRNPDVINNYWRLVEEHEVTVVGGIPTTVGAILNASTEGVNLASVRACMSGGAPVSQGVAQKIRLKTGQPFHQLYAMTESSGATAVDPTGAKNPKSSGLRVPYLEIAIRPLAPDAGALTKAAGRSGEIMLRGPQLFAGYTDPERDIGVLEEGWLHSGDLGYFDEDGWLFVTGRAKEVIIRGGHNIDPAGIEEVAATHPAVQDCIAVGRLDSHAGEVPVLFVTLKPLAKILPDDIRQFVWDRISERPARPKAVTILAQLPTTAVGKIQRNELKRLAAEQGVQIIVERHRLGDGAEVAATLEGDGRLKIEIRLATGISLDAPAWLSLEEDLERLAAKVVLRRPDGTQWSSQ